MPVFTSHLSTAATVHAYRDSLQLKESSRSNMRPNFQMESNEGRGYFRGRCYCYGGSHMANHCKEATGMICYWFHQPGISQLSVNREMATEGLWLQQSPPVRPEGAENADACSVSNYYWLFQLSFG